MRWACWPTFTWGGRDVCRHRHGVRDLPLRSVRGLLPPSAPARTCSSWGRASWWAECSSAGPIAATCALTGRSSALSRGGRSGTCKIPPERVHPVPAVRRCLPLRRDPRADRRAAAGRAARAAAGGWRRCWSCVPLLIAAGFWLGRQLEVPLATAAPDRPAGRPHPPGADRPGRRHDRRQRRLPQHGPRGRRSLPRGALPEQHASAGPAAGSAPGSGWSSA